MTLPDKVAYLEQRRRVRCDLFRYFETVLKELPSWNYFFEEMTGFSDLDGPGLLRGMCADLNNFDESALLYGSVVTERVTQYMEWRDSFDNFQSDTESDSELDAEFDLAWFQKFHRDVLLGVHYRSDVNAIETKLTEYHEPRLNAMIQVFEGISSEMISLLEKLIVTLGKLREALSQDLKDFEDCTTHQEKEVSFRNLKARVTETCEFMNDVNEMIEKILTDFGASHGRSEDLEGVTKQVEHDSV